MHANEARIREYLAAIEAGATGDELSRFFTDDVVQEEFPNRLVPNGATRTLADILDGAVRGQKVMRSQSFEVHNIVTFGATSAVELTWLGTLAIPLGSLAAGDRMRARFCMVVELEGDRIRRQRNYDCFDPF